MVDIRAHSVLNRKGERIGFYEAGSSTAPALVLIHGSPGASLCSWGPMMESLAETHHVVAVDLPGHGIGRRPSRGFRLEPFTLGECANDIQVVLAHLHVTSAVVAGYSLGGAVAQVFANKFPALAERLVLIGTSSRFSSSAFHRASLSWISRLPIPSLPTARTRRKSGFPDSRARALEALRTHPLAAIQAELACDSFDSSAWVGTLPMPVTVCATRNDDVVSREDQLSLRALIPGARLVELPSTRGHLTVPFPTPAAREALRRAIAGVPAPRTPNLQLR